MASAEREDITTLLDAVRAGDEASLNCLLLRLDAELRPLARAQLRREDSDERTDTTALINQVLIRLVQNHALERAPNRRYLFSAAGQILRHLLIDRARERKAERRGRGIWQRVPLDDLLDRIEENTGDFQNLHEALEQLRQYQPRAADVVTLRFLVGNTVGEVAQQLEISESTVESDWRFARAFLRAHLTEGDS